MGSRSQRKRQRRQSEEPSPERQFFYFNWRDSWGRPPAFYWWGMWIVNGPVALIGFGFAAGVAITGLSLMGTELSAALISLFAAFLLAAGSYFLFLRPLWRFHRYYLRFATKDGRSHVERLKDFEPDKAPGTDEGPTIGPIFPGTPPYQAAVRECTAAIDRDHQVRRAPQSEFRRAAALLHDVVRPAEYGQIDLVEAFDVRSEDRSLVYGIVSYNETVRYRKRQSQTTSVGHVIFLSLGADLGRIWIRPEGLMDKLGEFVFSRDIDFAEHPRFSRRYLLHADNSEELERLVPDEFWQALGDETRLVVVGRGTDLVIGKDGRIAPEDAETLVALGFRILQAFGTTP